MKTFNAKETLKPAMPLVSLKPVLVDASLIYGVFEMIWAQFSCREDLNPDLVSTHSNHGLILEKVWEVAMLKFRYCKSATKFLFKKLDTFLISLPS